jgi:hypothetical protein
VVFAVPRLGNPGYEDRPDRAGLRSEVPYRLPKVWIVTEDYNKSQKEAVSPPRRRSPVGGHIIHLHQQPDHIPELRKAFLQNIPTECAMSLRFIDEHENRLWSTRTGNSGLFERTLYIPGGRFSYQHKQQKVETSCSDPATARNSGHSYPYGGRANRQSVPPPQAREADRGKDGLCPEPSTSPPHGRTYPSSLLRSQGLRISRIWSSESDMWRKSS